MTQSADPPRSLSAPFIGRPVATTLLSVGVVLLGILAYLRMPIAALPSVDRPTIALWAGLPGASADTIATSLAQPLERQVGAIPGIAEMASFSATGGTQVTVQFELGQGVDAAAGAVQAAINAAGPALPRDLPAPPTYWKANPSGWSAIALSLTSDVVDATEVYDLADSVVAQKLSQLPGVAQVSVSGAERAAVRVRVQPQRLAQMGLSLEAVRQAVRDASMNLPRGGFSAGGQAYRIGANDQLFKAAEYREVVVAYRAGAAVRLGDVAEVVDAVVNTRLAGWYNGERGVTVRVYKQPDANVVATVDAVKAALPLLGQWLPPSVRMHVIYDRTQLIRASIREVQAAVALAVVLVVAVTALFLRRLRATAIPGLTIPVALAATMGAMRLLDYTFDNLSLMALTVAVGFVVDDAVIVVENAMRLVQSGVPPREAALRGARQIGPTIVAITAALVSALLPVLFMPDVVGRYFREFGMTLVAAVVASAVVSLTLTSMLCGTLLRNERHARPSRLAAAAGRMYEASLVWTLRHRALAVLATGFAAAATLGLYASMPKGFMPTQDTGVLYVRAITTANVSFTAMERLQRTVVAALLEDPAVEGLSSYIGTDNGSVLSNGEVLVGLKPPDVRPPIQAVIDRLRERLARVDGVRVFFTPVQDLVLGVGGSASRYQYVLTAEDPDRLYRWADTMRRRMTARRGVFADVIANNEESGLQATLQVDRVRAAALGVTPLAVDQTLYDAFGQRQVKTIYLPHNYARVVMEVDQAAQADPSALDGIYVPGTRGRQVPLSAVTRLTRAHGAMWMRHDGQFPSVTISFDLAPGMDLAGAMGTVRALEAELRLPDEIRAGFRGEAGEATKSGTRQAWLLGGAVFAVYVVLGVLYESFAHPATILSTLPSALLGALLALRLSGTQFTVMTAIACILVVGMAMRNAIMIVDFALTAQREERLPPAASVLRAARLRARPILMTTLAAVASALPLAFGTGPGYEIRQPVGIAVVGGLVLSQVLTLYSTPVFYLLVERFRTPRGSMVAALDGTGHIAAPARELP